MKKFLLWLVGAGVITGSAALLATLHPQSPHTPAIQAAINDLVSCDYEVREQAAQTLKEFGPAAVPYLMRALGRHENLWTRNRNRLPFFTFPRQDFRAIRHSSAEQLAAIAPNDERTLRALILALRDDNAEAQRALRKIAPLDHLTAALRDRDARIRRGAAEVLGDLGARAKTSAAALAHALRDKEEMVRVRAARALGTIGDLAAVEPLIHALGDPFPSVRSTSAEALGRLRASRAAPALSAKLSDSETMVRVKAAQAIWRIKGDAELVVPVLISALRDRRGASDAKFVLGEIGPAAEKAVPALVQCLREERVGRPLRTPPSSALALGRIGPVAVPQLIPVLDNAHPEVRTSAVIALGFVGRGAQDAVPHLMPMLKDKSLEVRQAAAIALGSIEPDNQDLIPALKQLARDDDIFLASAAAAMLRNLDPSATAELDSGR